MTMADATQSSPKTDPAALNQDALRALKSGDAQSARAYLSAAIQAEPATVSLHLNLAAACRALNDLEAAQAALDAALALDPRNFMALLMRATILERQGKGRLAGSAYGVALTQCPPADRLDPATRQAAERARAAFAAYQNDLADHLRQTLADEAGPSREDNGRLEAFVDRLTGRRRIFHQQPAQFTYPGLPAIEFYDRCVFPWLETLEAASNDIIGEFLQAMEDEAAAAGFAPYVEYPDGVPLDQWAELNHSLRWSAFHLYKDGAPVEANARRCPRTMAVLSAMPQPHTKSRSPAAMFSVLAPKTRIPPHTGVSNTRLVTHLPLVVPEGCGFRVGSSTRPWRVGEAFVFDDTIEHEAWNTSDTWRAVLIFDVWSPFIPPREQEKIVEVMEAMDAFHGASPGSDL